MTYAADPRVAEYAVEQISARAVLDSKNPRDYVAEFSDFLKSLGYKLNPERDVFALDTNDMEQCVTIFLSMKNWDNRSDYLEPVTTLQLLRHMGHGNNNALYKSLTPDAQRFLLCGMRSANGWTPSVYLRTLSAIESHPTELIKHDNYNEYRVYQNYLVKARVTRAIEEIRENFVNSDYLGRFDLTAPSIEFIEAATSRAVADLLMTNTHAVELLLLWKVLYSETVVMEMLHNFGSTRCELDQEDLMDLMEDWDKWKGYPGEWINEIYVGRHRKISI